MHANLKGNNHINIRRKNYLMVSYTYLNTNKGK